MKDKQPVSSFLVRGFLDHIETNVRTTEVDTTKCAYGVPIGDTKTSMFIPEGVDVAIHFLDGNTVYRVTVEEVGDEPPRG